MTWFRTVLALCLAGVLSPASAFDSAGEGFFGDSFSSPRSLKAGAKDQPGPSMQKHQKKIVGQVMSHVGNTVAQVVAEHRNETTKDGPLPNKGVPGTFPFNNPAEQMVRETEGGVSKIYFFEEGVICSGIHFKPWIILTTGDCLSGRDVKRLYASVTRRDSKKNAFYTVLVQAESVTMDPGYQYGQRAHNLAILQVYGRFDWDVEEFTPPRRDIKPANLIDENIQTYVKEWTTTKEEDYTMLKVKRSVTKDRKICGDTPGGKYWYCVPQADRATYTGVDIGTPFYFEKNTIRRCLGIYTGEHLDEVVKGHLFQSIYQSVDWIDEYIHEHPVPPMPV